MNQQRCRRYVKVSDKQREAEVKQSVKEAWQERGHPLPPEEKVEMNFDSNSITPGTAFMDRVSRHLQYYVHDRLQNDEQWKDLLVVVSDASVPGEGEHKLLDFIRAQRQSAEYNPHTRHCIVGSDADLILLGLGTHERNFTILRDQGNSYRGADDGGLAVVSLAKLREYLAHEFQELIALGWELEWMIEDFIFLSFFVGNDFLPHIPTLDIRAGALDMLLEAYVDILLHKPQTTPQGYLTDGHGSIQMPALQELLDRLALLEANLLHAKMEAWSGPKAPWVYREYRAKPRCGNETQAEIAKRWLQEIEYETKQRDAMDADQARRPEADCMPGTQPWREAHYAKFVTTAPGNRDRAWLGRLSADYIEGLAWVMRYYVHGTPSWGWYYPHYYAPLLADLTTEGCAPAVWSGPCLDAPLSPMEQLMCVLPPESADLLPRACRDLMLAEDSPLKPFYPHGVREEPGDGNKPRWKWTVILPFMDAARVQDAVQKASSQFTASEMARNVHGGEIALSAPRSRSWCSLMVDKSLAAILQNSSIGTLHGGVLTQGVAGMFKAVPLHTPGETYPAPSRFLPALQACQVCSVGYTLPAREEHMAACMPGGQAGGKPLIDPKMVRKQRLQYQGRPFGNHKREWLSREAQMVEQVEFYFGNKNYFKEVLTLILTRTLILALIGRTNFSRARPESIPRSTSTSMFYSPLPG